MSEAVSDDSKSESEDRYVEQRSRFLARRYGLRDPVATALAWSELGYSVAGIAKQTDRGESTIDDYFETIETQLGQAALFPVPESERAIDRELTTSDNGGDGQ